MVDNVVNISTRGNNNNIAVHVESPISSDPLSGWDVGLPRTRNPNTGVDDTEARKAQCEEAYKLRHYNNAQQVRTLRRGLYMSIVQLRTSSNCGYALDGVAEKTPYRSVLQ